MNSTQSIDIREAIFPAIISMALFSAAIFVHPLGIVLSIFSPLPIILAYLYRGQRTGLVSLAVVTVILLFFVNAQISLVFLVEYGLLAVVMAESIRRNYSINKIVLYSVGASLLFGGTLTYFLLLGRDVNISSILMEQIKQSMDSSMTMYTEMGGSTSEMDNLKLYSEKLASALITSIPAWMIVSSCTGVLINYSLVKMVWNKYIGSGDYFENPDLNRWSASEYLLWLLIGSGAMLLVSFKSLNIIGTNLLIVSLMAYFYQGVAIILFYMKKKTFPLFLKIFVFALIVIQPLILLFVILLGLFDAWGDFRKLKKVENRQDTF